MRAPASTRLKAAIARPTPRARFVSRRLRVVKRIQEEPAVAGFKEYTRVIALAGGLPIKVGDEVIGAVGVSGSPGKDDDCAQAGIDKVADQLK